MGIEDKKPAKGRTGEKLPKGATASDTSGERKERLVGGVAMGKKDAIGADKQFKGGSSEKICYDHKRSDYKVDF